MPLPPNPLVSVLIVNYNYGRFIGAAINSVLRQSYRQFEIVIVDDGSTDDSRNVIQSYATREASIKTVFKANARVAAALNDAYRSSTGAIIALLDADDQFQPNKLQRVLDAFKQPSRPGLVMDALIKVDAGNHPIGRIPELGRFDRGEMRSSILQTAGHFYAAPTSALAMRRECAEKVFPIPEREFSSEADAYMRTVAALHCAVETIDEPLTIYRVHSSNVTASSTVDLAWCERALSAQQRVYDVLRREAERHEWSDLTRLEQSPDYCEMAAVRACLMNASRRDRVQLAARFTSAARNVASADRSRVINKARALALVARFPRRLRDYVLTQIYQPSGLKKFVRQLLRRK